MPGMTVSGQSRPAGASFHGDQQSAASAAPATAAQGQGCVRASRTHVGDRHRVAAHGRSRQRDDDRQRHDHRNPGPHPRHTRNTAVSAALLSALPPATRGGSAGCVLARGRRIRPRCAPGRDGIACTGRQGRAGSTDGHARRRTSRPVAPLVAGALRAAIRHRQRMDHAPAPLLCRRHRNDPRAAVADRAGLRPGPGGRPGIRNPSCAGLEGRPGSHRGAAVAQLARPVVAARR